MCVLRPTASIGNRLHCRLWTAVNATAIYTISQHAGFHRDKFSTELLCYPQPILMTF